MIWLIAIPIAFALLFVMGACRLAGEADDAADKAARDLTDADRITPINFNTGRK